MHPVFMTVLIVVFVAAGAFADVPAVDAGASFSGPFSGASAQEEMAQTFVVTETGFLQKIEVYVPSSTGVSCEFTWFLRHGSTFNPGAPNIPFLRVLLSGTGMTDVPAGGIYDASSSVLVDGANLQVNAGDLLVLHIVKDCSFNWISGIGDLDGEQYKYFGGEWTAASVPGREFGRIISTSGQVSAETENWSGLKTMYR